jgi:hypothetical protein
MSLFKKILGTIEDKFHIGNILGPMIKNNAGVLEARNNDDSAYIEIKGAPGTSENSFVTKKQFETTQFTAIVSRQADTTSAIPGNTGVKGTVVVTTPGTGAVLGDLLYDDGSGSGLMEILGKVNGRSIFITVALTGGNVEFVPESIYQWDDDGSSGSVKWVKIGDVGFATAPIRLIRYAIDNTADQDSTALIPANARILKARLEVSTGYSPTADVTVGIAGNTSLFLGSGDSNPQTENEWEVDQDTDVGGADAAVKTTVTNTPAAGAGVVSIWYSNAEA